MTDATLTLTGEPLDPDRHTITLDDGWNWVGYLPAEASSLDAALDNLPATAGDAVRAQELAATADDLRSLAAALADETAAHGVCVFGGRDAVEASGLAFDSVVELVR